MGMRLSPKRRGRSDSGFQWLMIGIVLGMGCAFSFGLGLYVFEIIEVSVGTEEPTSEPAQVVYITPTLDESDPTATTTTEVAGTTEEATTTNNEPTPLPGVNQETPAPSSIENTPLPGGPTPTPTIGLSIGSPSSVQPTQTSSSSVIVSSGVSAPEGLIPSPLVVVQGGQFKMGTTDDEGQQAVAECVSRDAGTCESWMVADSIPAHDIYVDTFQIEQYEVSVSQYVAFLNYLYQQNPTGPRPHLTACNGPCVLVVGDAGGENSDIAFVDGQGYILREAGVDRSNYPITLVLWEGARKYCEILGRYLPTEAQWERAARGPNNYIYPWGPQWNPNNANTKRSGTNGEGTVEVNSFADGQSAWGAVNMAGNVAEWTADYYSEALYQTRASSLQVVNNPIGPSTGTDVVARGGSWDAVPLFARAVHRREFAPGNGYPNVGFRCAAPAQ